ncbi:MAG: hypothetical protein MUC83_03000 [Pirellula sp.]|jgi:hypothetical protein|nr:hypothetical protein [Pirellula sp.]
MIEKDYRMDEELTRFEQDLRSLTPKPCSATASVPTMPLIHNNGLNSHIGIGVATDHQSSSWSFTNRSWFKTVAVSWATGLAAGLLVSAIWTKLMEEETSNNEPSLLTENNFAAGVSEPNTPLSVSQNSTSKTTSRQQSLSPQPFTTQSLSTQRGIVRNIRNAPTHFPDHEILHPFMALNNVNWNAGILPHSKRPTAVQSGTKKASEQANAPGAASGDSQKSIPVSIPKTQGQRELLKSLMESDDLISI